MTEKEIAKEEYTIMQDIENSISSMIDKLMTTSIALIGLSITITKLLTSQDQLSTEIYISWKYLIVGISLLLSYRVIRPLMLNPIYIAYIKRVNDYPDPSINRSLLSGKFLTNLSRIILLIPGTISFIIGLILFVKFYINS